MKGFSKVLSAVVVGFSTAFSGNGSVNGKRSKRRQNTSLRFEGLESRLPLAGGGGVIEPAIAPVMKVVEQKVPALVITSGAAGQVLTRFTAAATKGVGRLEGVSFLPMARSQNMEGNIFQANLWADLNADKKDGPLHDGYETCVGYGVTDPNTSLTDFSAKSWVVSPRPVKYEVVAHFNGYLTGDRIGMKLVQARFTDLTGKMVLDQSVRYGAVRGAPTLHKMDDAYGQMAQMEMLPYGSVRPGDKNVVFWQGCMVGKKFSLDKVVFPLAQGNTADITNYRLTFVGWGDGKSWFEVKGTVVGDTVQFNLKKCRFVDGGYLQLSGDIVAQPTATKFFQFGAPVTVARSTNTGKLFKEGQFATYGNIWSPTIFNLVVNMQAGVQEFTPDQIYNVASVPGQEMIMDRLVVKSNDVLARLSFCGTYDVRYANGYTLWADTNGNGIVDTKVAAGRFVDADYGIQVWFDGFNLSISNEMIFEVRAYAPNPLNNQMLRLQFAGANGIDVRRDGVTFGTGQIFVEGRTQTNWWMSDQGGLG